MNLFNESSEAADAEQYAESEPEVPAARVPDAQMVIVQPTGHVDIDSALQALARDAGAHPADQVAGYETLRRTLDETLSGIEEG